MNKNILPKVQQKVWNKLTAFDPLKNFYLAGGTAVALRLEHRESIDFDFFTEDDFDSEKIAFSLGKLGKFSAQSIGQGTLLGMLDGVKISFFKLDYGLLGPGDLLDGISVALLQDLAVMKLIAIAQRGTKKDFVDMYEIINSGFTIGAMLELAEKKLGGVNWSKAHYLKSLTYFDDAEEDEMPKMLKTRTWKKIRQFLESTVREYLKKVT